MNRIQVERLEGRVRDARDVLDGFLARAHPRGTATVLSDLIRRTDQTSEVDGYPRGGEQERTSGGGIGDPTLASVAAREADVCPQCVEGVFTLRDGRKVACRACEGSGRRWADPVPAMVADILTGLREAVGATRRVDHRLKELNRSAKAKEGRESSIQGHCLICGSPVSGVGEDRLKRGCCPRRSCYPAWIEWRKAHPSCGDPIVDFQRFQAQAKVPDKEVSVS